MMLDYAGARAVAMIVRTGSFDGAARALNVTPSAISQRVRTLEEGLGAVLILRGQPCRATEAGAWLCRHIEHVGMLEDALLQHLPGLVPQDGPPRVTLEIATNADSLGTWFLPAVTAFAKESGYLLNIAVDDEQHTADWLRQGRVLAAVTSRANAVPGCAIRPLGRLRYRAVASPDFLRRHFPDGVDPAALTEAPALGFNRKDGLQRAWVQQVFGSAPALPAHGVPSTHGFVDACVQGLGWGLNPDSLVEEHLKAGRLAELVPDTPLHVPLFWQISRLAADRLTGLTAAVQAAAGQALLPPDRAALSAVNR